MKLYTLQDLKRKAADRSNFQKLKRIRAEGNLDELNVPADDSDSSLQTWACPFFRHDPLGNMNYLKLKLKRIRDVKQHIQRQHNSSCHRCLQSLASQKKKEEHLKAGMCEINNQSASSSKAVLSMKVQKKVKNRALRSKSGDQ
uniref:Uncharacterized protein n=1 Tax=Bionectria ochroleuca TaxID=29856 RepID=A0A8H7K7M9_BIOOC